MRKFIYLFLATTLLMSSYALSETIHLPSKTVKAKKCLFPKSRKRAPSWVCNQNENEPAISAVGSFSKSKADIDFKEQMAASDARTKLAEKLYGTIIRKISSSEGQANENFAAPDKTMIVKITTGSLEGTKILHKAYAPNGRVYVLIVLDEPATQNLYETVAAEYQKQIQKQ